MRIALTVLFMALACEVFSATPQITEVRRLFKKSATEEAACKQLLLMLKPYNANENPLLAGYRAASTMMMANYVTNPYSKWNYFSEGKELMEASIKADVKNTELRFLRFGVQTKAPSFLGYNNAIEEDKAFIIQSLSQIKDQQLKQTIVSFMMKSEYMTSSEKKKIDL